MLAYCMDRCLSTHAAVDIYIYIVCFFLWGCLCVCVCVVVVVVIVLVCSCSCLCVVCCCFGQNLKQNEAQKDQQTRELISAQKMSHKCSNKNLRRLQLLSIRGCTSGGVDVPCIYSYAMWELPYPQVEFLYLVFNLLACHLRVTVSDLGLWLCHCAGVMFFKC